MKVKSEGNFYLFIVSKGGEGGKGYETDSHFESVQRNSLGMMKRQKSRVRL